MSKNSFKYRFKNNLVEPSKYLDTYTTRYQRTMIIQFFENNILLVLSSMCQNVN